MSPYCGRSIHSYFSERNKGLDLITHQQGAFHHHRCCWCCSEHQISPQNQCGKIPRGLMMSNLTLLVKPDINTAEGWTALTSSTQQWSEGHKQIKRENYKGENSSCWTLNPRTQQHLWACDLKRRAGSPRVMCEWDIFKHCVEGSTDSLTSFSQTNVDLHCTFLTLTCQHFRYSLSAGSWIYFHKKTS